MSDFIYFMYAFCGVSLYALMKVPSEKHFDELFRAYAVILLWPVLIVFGLVMLFHEYLKSRKK